MTNMVKTEAFETICPICNSKTYFPAAMNDYEFEQDRYYSKPIRFYCIYCQGAIEVKAYRGILDMKRC